MKLIAVLPQGLEEEGAKELIELGAKSVVPKSRSVLFNADWSCFYRVHLCARLPFRFLREIAEFQCNSPESLYENVQRAFDWKEWIHPSLSFRVDVSGSTYGLPSNHYSALQVKNAIIDVQRSYFGLRSNVNLDKPEFCIHLHLGGGKAALSFASSTHSMHRRGFRPAMGLAPLKENIAAGLIRATQWNYSTPLIDPLCGSGTFLIEAVSIALGLQTGLKQSFLFEQWLDFDSQLWANEKEIVKQHLPKTNQLPLIIGCEKNFDIAEQARINIAEANLQSFIEVKNIHFGDLSLPDEKGILLCNPPYGKRLGNQNELELLYKELGIYCKTKASGWNLWLLSGNANLTKFLKMKATKRMPISNGGIDCRWLNYRIN